MSPEQPRRARTAVGVIVVDDQAVFRSVAREVIDATPGFEALGEAGCADEALALAEQVDPDLVLLDVRTCNPAWTIVLISTENVDRLSAGVASCGAAALLRKDDLAPSTLQRVWAEHGSP